MASDPAAFVDGLIGRAYEPQGLHCWALVRLAQQALFGRELPLVLGAPERKRELVELMARRHGHPGWREVDSAEHGAVVFMTRRGHGPSRSAIHAGTYLTIDGGGILHTDEPHGVVFETPAELTARNWADLSFHIPT